MVNIKTTLKYTCEKNRTRHNRPIFNFSKCSLLCLHLSLVVSQLYTVGVYTATQHSLIILITKLKETILGIHFHKSVRLTVGTSYQFDPDYAAVD